MTWRLGFLGCQPPGAATGAHIRAQRNTPPRVHCEVIPRRKKEDLYSLYGALHMCSLAICSYTQWYMSNTADNLLRGKGLHTYNAPLRIYGTFIDSGLTCDRHEPSHRRPFTYSDRRGWSFTLSGRRGRPILCHRAYICSVHTPDVYTRSRLPGELLPR